MIKIDDTIIQADTLDMIKTLKAELYSKGIDRFHVFRNNGDNIQTNCPFHKNGQERKPSFGVNGNLNKCHCFACGWSGGIEEMISELFGFVDSKYGKRWLVKRFNIIEIESRPNILENFGGRKNVRNSIRCDNISNGAISYSPNFIGQEELYKYRYIHPYMYERGLTDEIIERFDVGYDREKEAITFPILDLRGNCVFVATRSIKTKFFGLPRGLDKPVYLAYQFRTGKYSQAYICESFLNCLTLWKLGLPAMAMIGTGNRKQYKILESLPVREYILAFDPDEAGRKATQRFKENVKGKILKEIIYTEEGKDINDLQEEFLKLDKKFL